MAQLYLNAQDGAERRKWHDLFLNAFGAENQDAEAVRILLTELRNLSSERLDGLGLSKDASDLDLYEFIMREGAALLLLLEKP